MSWQTAYQSAQGCVSWQGNTAKDGDKLNAFMQGSVAKRLNDTDGSEVLSEHLRGLSLTGMGQNALEAVLVADVPEIRDWAVGEALAEAVLEVQHNVIFPWNNERDKRNPFASLPGADIVGFQQVDDSHRLVLGEVKCSSEAKWPPQVMSGKSGMIHQLETLASNLAIICQLFKYLLPRVKNTQYETIYNLACTRYFNSGNLDLLLFGILVRDQAVQEKDLQYRGHSLATKLKTPTQCQLLALYLPWPIAQLPDMTRQEDKL